MTYAAVGNLGGRYTNSNFSQRVMLAPERVELTVLVPRASVVSGELPANAELRRARLPGLWGFYLHVLRSLAGRVGRRSDVVVSDRSAASIAAWAMRRASGYRWVADLWDTPHKELVVDYSSRRGARGVARRLVSRGKVAVLGSLLRRADLVLCSLLPGALERYGIDPDRLRTFVNAIDLDALPTLEAGAERRPDRACYVTSRFVGDRGLEELVGAVELVAEDGDALQVDLVGELTPEQERRVGESPAGGCFSLHGSRSLEGAYEVMLGAAIGLAPFRSNEDLDHTFPIKICEYMALGCVVVAADLPGIRAMVGEDGVLVRPGDPGALAGALAALIADPDRLVGLRAGGLERAREFDAREKTRRVYDCLAEVA